MGVLGLLTLLKTNRLGEYVKLADITADYRKKTGKRPVLLVDCSSCLRYLYPEKSLDLGGKLKKFKESCEEFLDRLHDLDIQLYVIESGLRSDVYNGRWVESMDQLVERLNLAYSTHDITLAKVRGGFEYGIAIQVFTLSDKCEFYRSDYEATHYIAQYLRENGAFGVISNNSDIILMEGYHYFLGIEYLNLSEMTAFNFSRDKLAEFLDIRPQLLPHVGARCPNNIVDFSDFKNFHSRYCRNTDKDKKFKIVADVVRTYLSDFDPNDYSPVRLQYYQSKLCLNKHQMERYMKRLKILNGVRDEESETMENKHWNDILTLAKTLHRTGRIERHVLRLLLKKEFFCSLILENVNMSTPGEALQNLRRNIYRFLFFEYPEEVSVTEHLYAFRNGRTGYCFYEMTFERRDHVGLLELWSENAPEDIQKKKYRYFFEIINEKLDPDILLGKVEQEFIFPLLAAFYLHYVLGKFNSSKMIDVFLIHSILANKLSANEMAEFDCEPDFDALNMCGWYLIVIEHLELINSVCGNPFDKTKTCIVNYFDGELLQTVYRDINGGQGVPEELIPAFKSLKKVLIEMKQCCGF